MLYDELQREDNQNRGEKIAMWMGRLIFGGYFVYNGINHFLNKEHMAGYAGSKGVPKPDVAVQATGALMIVGGLSVLTGYKPKVGAALIGTFLTGVTPSIHTFWKEEDPQRRQMEMVNFLKNVALFGGAMIAAGRAEPRRLAPAA